MVSAATEDPPSLSLAGGTERTVLRAASLIISAIAEVETCVTNKTSVLTYKWSELRTARTFESTSAVSHELRERDMVVVVGEVGVARGLERSLRSENPVSELMSLAYRAKLVLKPSHRNWAVKENSGFE